MMRFVLLILCCLTHIVIGSEGSVFLEELVGRVQTLGNDSYAESMCDRSLMKCEVSSDYEIMIESGPLSESKWKHVVNSSSREEDIKHDICETNLVKSEIEKIIDDVVPDRKMVKEASITTKNVLAYLNEDQEGQER